MIRARAGHRDQQGLCLVCDVNGASRSLRRGGPGHRHVVCAGAPLTSRVFLRELQFEPLRSSEVIPRRDYRSLKEPLALEWERQEAFCPAEARRAFQEDANVGAKGGEPECGQRWCAGQVRRTVRSTEQGARLDAVRAEGRAVRTGFECNGLEAGRTEGREAHEEATQRQDR